MWNQPIRQPRQNVARQTAEENVHYVNGRILHNIAQKMLGRKMQGEHPSLGKGLLQTSHGSRLCSKRTMFADNLHRAIVGTRRQTAAMRRMADELALWIISGQKCTRA
jgi:hypothetical protein